MLFRALITLLVAGGLTVGTASMTGCAGGEGYKLPVSHPLVPFKKPTRGDLVEDEIKTEPVNKQPPPDMGDDDDDGAAPAPKPSVKPTGKSAK